MNLKDFNKSLGKKKVPWSLSKDDWELNRYGELVRKNPVKKNVDKQSESEYMQDQLEPIYHPTEHDESDDIEDAKRLEE